MAPISKNIMSISKNEEVCPLVSVIIPAFNREKSIHKAITSVQTQDWKNLEIIVIDDNSEDGTVKIVKSIDDKRIKLIERSENGGAGNARNDGIRAAKGKYIAFLDSDDYFLPGKISFQVSAMQDKKNDARISVTALNLELKDEGILKQKYHSYPADEFLALFKGCDLSPGATMMVEQSVFAEVGLFNTSLRRFEDWEWLLRATKVSPILRLNKILSHVSNVRGRLSRDVFDSAVRFIEIRRSKYPHLRKSTHKHAELLIWNQVLGTAIKEKNNFQIILASLIKIFVISPVHLFFLVVKSYKSKISKKRGNLSRLPSVAFVIHGLSGGGAERVIVNLANGLSKRGWSVRLLHYQSFDHKADSKIFPDVKLIPLGFKKKPNFWLARKILYLRQSVELRKILKKEKVDILVSFMDAVNIHAIFSMLFSGIPVLICERIDPRFHPVKNLIKKLRNVFYPFAAALIIQTKSASLFFSEKVRSKTYILKNPIDISKHSHLVDCWSMSNQSILAIGRLEEQKGFDILIDAFYEFSKIYPDWKLTILGSGSKLNVLKSQIKRLSLDEKVLLPGVAKDINPYLKTASIFVSSSRYEGFPNVLLEAMAAGRPVVSSNFFSGASELLGNNEFGLLVTNESASALSSGIKALVSNPDLAETYRRAGFERVKNYNEPIVLNNWDNFIKSFIS